MTNIISIIVSIISIISVIGSIFYFSSNIKSRITVSEKRTKVLEEEYKHSQEEQTKININHAERISKLEGIQECFKK